jgi:hypothetical protein
LVVVTATGYGYVRKDGVTVVPIGALTLSSSPEGVEPTVGIEPGFACFVAPSGMGPTP